MFATALLPEQPRQRAEDPSAARKLFAGLLEDPVDELQVAADHPLGRPRDFGSAEELEGGPDGDHDTAVQVGLQPAHEDLLLGGSESHPDDVGTVGLHHTGNLRVVELLNLAERQLNKLHLRHIGIFMDQILLESVKNGLRGSHEDHTILAAVDDVHEDLTAAVLLETLSVDPSDVERDVAAVADGEHAAVNDLEIFGVPVCGIEDHAVGHTDVVSLVCLQLLCDAFVYGRLVEFVTDVEVVFHKNGMFLIHNCQQKIRQNYLISPFFPTRAGIYLLESLITKYKMSAVKIEHDKPIK